MKRLFVSCSLLVCLPLFAQSFVAETNTYGTVSESVVTIPAAAFVPTDSRVTFITSALSPDRFITGGPGTLEAALTLPEGAALTGIQVEGCDSSANGSLNVLLNKCAVLGACSTPGAIVTGVAATPGCASTRQNLAGQTIDNIGNMYFIDYSNPGDVSGNVSFRAVRVFYKLQFSPAPATATFTDVPVGHPQHRFVEALAAAGITGGCGNGNYCPDAPVTRGQMAVFLTVALGLHWTP